MLIFRSDPPYAEALLATSRAAEFQRTRRRRNRTEYGDLAIGRVDLDADLAHADAIIEAVKLSLSPDHADDTLILVPQLVRKA